MKIVIVGAVAGGASAAARARRLDEDAEIILLERGEAPSFANCGLPYYIGGVIQERDKLLVAPKQRLVERYRLDVRTRSEVLSIDRQARKVHIRELESGREYSESYDKLILSPGAVPIRPPIPGANLPNVFTLRDLRDADQLFTVTSTAKNAVIVGAGFIGLEMAENLVHRGIQTTVVELANQILPPWDPEMVSPIADHLRAKGVQLVLSDAVEAIEPQNGQLHLRLRSGKKLTADFVVLSVGVRPENKLAVDAELEVGKRGGIRVNEYMQTSDPDIYAVGDAVETFNFVDGSPSQIPLAGPANRQGRIAADHIFGHEAHFRGTQGTAIVGVFEMAAAMTGFSEKALSAANVPYEKIYVHPANHAGYYPGAEQMSLKLLFAPSDGKILGAQVAGRSGVDKRIDVLAVAIQAGMTVYDLEEMELAYAPQFGSAKDPVNMAGFVAAGVLEDLQPIAHFDQTQDNEDKFLVDVRSPEEFARGNVPGAVNIPIEQLRERLEELPRDQPILAYCQVGQRGYLATRILAQRGFNVANLSGGYTTYKQVMAAREQKYTEDDMDKETLIKKLNEDLAGELSAIIQYLTYAAKATGPYRPQLAEFFLAEVPDEQGHAQFLANKIVALGGEPTTVPRPVAEAHSNHEMLEAILKAEKKATADYTQRAKDADAFGDKGLAVQLEDMVRDESGHAEETERILRDWPLK